MKPRDGRKGTLRIVRPRLGQAEDDHGAVPHEARHAASERRDLALNKLLEIRKQVARPLPAESFGQAGEPGQIEKHNGRILLDGMLEKMRILQDPVEEKRRLELGELGSLAGQALLDLPIERDPGG